MTVPSSLAKLTRLLPIILVLLTGVGFFLFDLRLDADHIEVWYIVLVISTLLLESIWSTFIVTVISVIALISVWLRHFGVGVREPLWDPVSDILEVALVAALVIYRKASEGEFRGSIERVRARESEILTVLSNPAFNGGEFEQAIQAITEAASTAMQVGRASVWLFEDSGQTLRCVDLFEQSSSTHSSGMALTAAQYPRYFEALKSGRLINATDAFNDPRTSEYRESYLKPLNVFSLLDAAVHFDGKIVGVVCHESVGVKREWTSGEISFTAEIADQVSQALANREKRISMEALRESESKYRNLVETSNDLIWSVDAEGRFTFLNRKATRRIYGCEPEEMLGRPFTDFLDAEQLKKDLAVFEEIKQGKSYFSYETRHRTKDGRGVHLSFNAIVLKNEKGEVIGSTGTATDISARKEGDAQRSLLEEQLRQSQKMEALGILAGGIAHDFNNILSSISGYSELIRLSVSNDPKLSSSVDAVLIGAKRGKELVQQILAFSRRSAGERSVVFVDAVIGEVLKLLKVSLPSALSVTTELESGLTTQGNAGEIYQVLMNICNNAVFAMREKGNELKIKARKISTNALNPAVAAQLGVETTNQTYIEVAVKDLGVGISPENLPKIFVPFFTTKPINRGTGLGLSVAHGIMAAHNGKIRVESKEGEGSTFYLYFPFYSCQPFERSISQPNHLKQGTERVLVVDDEEMIAYLAKETLGLYGYHVTACIDPTEALELLTDDPSAYDLLITDLTMSPIGGVELIKKLNARGIKLPSILCSGYCLSQEELVEAETIFDARLAKPFSLQDFLSTVRQVLDRSAEMRSIESPKKALLHDGVNGVN